MIELAFFGRLLEKKRGGGGFIVLHLSLVNPPLDLSLDQTAEALWSAALLLARYKTQASDGTFDKCGSTLSQNITFLLGIIWP